MAQDNAALNLRFYFVAVKDGYAISKMNKSYGCPWIFETFGLVPCMALNSVLDTPLEGSSLLTFTMRMFALALKFPSPSGVHLSMRRKWWEEPHIICRLIIL